MEDVFRSRDREMQAQFSGSLHGFGPLRFPAPAIVALRLDKSAIDDLDDQEFKGCQKLAAILLGFSDAELAKAIKSGELRELDYDAE